jgi:hypothetical protein
MPPLRRWLTHPPASENKTAWARPRRQNDLTIASDATQAKATHVGVRVMMVSVRLKQRIRVHNYNYSTASKGWQITPSNVCTQRLSESFGIIAQSVQFWQKVTFS